MLRILIYLIPLFLLVGDIGCDKRSGGDTSPDIIGHISSLVESPTEPGAGSILIESPLREDSVFDRASVRVDSQTMIIDKTNGAAREAKFEFLAAGQKVEAMFSGPVAESYPVQAYASRVTVVEDIFFETGCQTDGECALINSGYGFNCCAIGVCESVDYADEKWISVNAEWFDSRREENCPAIEQCGPIPGCAIKIVNDGYFARCIENVCVKINL